MFWLTNCIWPGQHSLNMLNTGQWQKSVNLVKSIEAWPPVVELFPCCLSHMDLWRYVKQIFRFYIFRLHIHNLLAAQHLLGTDHLLIRATTRYRLACSNLPLTSILTVYPVMLGWWSTTPPWTKALIKLPCRCEIDPGSFDCKSILTFWLSPMD